MYHSITLKLLRHRQIVASSISTASLVTSFLGACCASSALPDPFLSAACWLTRTLGGKYPRPSPTANGPEALANPKSDIRQVRGAYQPSVVIWRSLSAARLLKTYPRHPNPCPRDCLPYKTRPKDWRRHAWYGSRIRGLVCPALTFRLCRSVRGELSSKPLVVRLAHPRC